MATSNHTEPEFHAAKNFGADLDAVFGMDKPLAELSQKVEEKKKEVDSQAEELAAIENRLKEAEARLAKVSGGSVPPTPTKYTTAPPTAQYTHNGVLEDRPPAPPKDNGANFSRPHPPPSYSGAPQAQEPVPRKPMNPRQDSFGLPPIPGAMPVTPMETRGNSYVQSGNAR
ncbi:Hypothetical protein D9617_18g033360 [Elsinoe fawcettii]|nr:Hypothetical protein D9617_18g033360 [Elsinoe fawcettii]